MEQRQGCFLFLQNTIQKRFRGAKLFPYGSTTSLFSTAKSDLDVSLVIAKRWLPGWKQYYESEQYNQDDEIEHQARSRISLKRFIYALKGRLEDVSKGICLFQTFFSKFFFKIFFQNFFFLNFFF